MKNSVSRFDGRVEFYAKYRPGYPEQIISLLEKKIDFDVSKDVADIGCGTGILSRLFLNNGNLVFGIEPNNEMRKAAEEKLEKYLNFTCLKGTAEETMLADKSVEIITAGQSFHWFDSKKAKSEFKRILRPGGHVVIIWNERKNVSMFMKAYNKLLKSFSKELDKAKDNIADKEFLKSFFGHDEYHTQTLPNFQILDFNGLKGRILSISYIPLEGPEHKEIMNGVKDIFEKFNNGGQVKLEYATRVFIGNL